MGAVYELSRLSTLLGHRSDELLWQLLRRWKKQGSEVSALKSQLNPSRGGEWGRGQMQPCITSIKNPNREVKISEQKQG
ncbi:hypothetical protein Oscil6304_1637 [Oscillatoria acuminata PCC 6304]|uniref:Uncharacterized protein n=1 Tax=Oscillatoria acuminata PCC 6304 TaxID=56110 RepID=K9TH53_9CYAN|nr:hypothetical protein Oscil6304_1637 [Oscillatoria acuminata PCC 6304]